MRSLSGPITVCSPSAFNSMWSLWELMSRFRACPWTSFGPAITKTTEEITRKIHLYFWYLFTVFGFSWDATLREEPNLGGRRWNPAQAEQRRWMITEIFNTISCDKHLTVIHKRPWGGFLWPTDQGHITTLRNTPITGAVCWPFNYDEKPQAWMLVSH